MVLPLALAGALFGGGLFGLSESNKREQERARKQQERDAQIQQAIQQYSQPYNPQQPPEVAPPPAQQTPNEFGAMQSPMNQPPIRKVSPEEHLNQPFNTMMQYMMENGATPNQVTDFAAKHRERLKGLQEAQMGGPVGQPLVEGLEKGKEYDPRGYSYEQAMQIYDGDMTKWIDDVHKYQNMERMADDAKLGAETAAINLANARNDRAAEKITNLWSKETDSINQWRDNPSTRYESDVMDKPPPNRLLRNDMRYAIDLARSGEAGSTIFGDYRGAGVAEIKAWFGNSFENLMKGLAGDFAFSLISDRGDPRPSDKDVEIMSGRFSSSPLGLEEATRRLINIDSSMYIDTAGIDSIKRYRTQLIQGRETAVNELMSRAEDISYDEFAREMAKIKNKYPRTSLDQFMDHQKHFADKIYDEFLYNHLDRSENGEINPDMFYVEPEILKDLEANSLNEDGIIDLQLLYQRLAVYKATSWQNARVVMP